MYKHRFDPISFVFGLAFIALALMFTLPTDPWDLLFGGINLGWLWPLVIIAAGAALLAPVMRNDQETPDDADTNEV